MSSTSSRMRKEYRQRRAAVLEAFRTSPFAGRITIFEQGLQTALPAALGTGSRTRSWTAGPGHGSQAGLSRLLCRDPPAGIRPHAGHQLRGTDASGPAEAMERLSARLFPMALICRAAPGSSYSMQAAYFDEAGNVIQST